MPRNQKGLPKNKQRKKELNFQAETKLETKDQSAKTQAAKNPFCFILVSSEFTF